jgi:hypothetical protein
MTKSEKAQKNVKVNKNAFSTSLLFLGGQFMVYPLTKENYDCGQKEFRLFSLNKRKF